MSILKKLANQRPVIVGVCNMTPDSFSDGGEYASIDGDSKGAASKAKQHIEQLIKHGATIIDIGAESTRPGADTISEDEQINRLTPVVGLFKHVNVPISIDTTRARVFDFCASHGARILNDISALEDDPEMVHVVQKHNASVMIMHRQGVSKTMQDAPSYSDVVRDVYKYLENRVAWLQAHGIHDIVIDPGIGFGKTLDQNLAILKHIKTFCNIRSGSANPSEQHQGCPVLVGTSNKSFIHALDESPVKKRVGGTIVSNILAYENGASFFRVHDVQTMNQAFKMYRALKKEGEHG